MTAIRASWDNFPVDSGNNPLDGRGCRPNGGIGAGYNLLSDPIASIGFIGVMD